MCYMEAAILHCIVIRFHYRHSISYGPARTYRKAKEEFHHTTNLNFKTDAVPIQA